MKKNNLFTLAFAACALLLSACSTELDTSDNPLRVGTDEVLIAVSLQFPKGDAPVGYAPGDQGDEVLPGVALPIEKEIKSIAFIAFTKGGTSIYLSKNPTLSDNGFTEPLTHKNEAVPGEYTAKFKIKSGDFDGKTTIVAVANYFEHGLTFDGATLTLDGLKKMLSDELTTEADKNFIDYPLLMTMAYEGEIVEGSTVPIAFVMERIMARIDVVNNAFDKTTPANDFVLTSAQLISAPSQGTMIAGQTGVVPSGYIDLLVHTDVKEVAPANDQPVSPTNPARQQLEPMYVYENSNTDKNDPTKLSATATYVLVKGTYKGMAYDKKIEFRTLEKNVAGVIEGGLIVPIARNTRYVLEISSSSEGKPVFDVKVTDWAEGEKLEVGIDFTAPVLEGLDKIPPVTSGATWDAATKTLNITKATAPVDISFMVRGFQDSDFTMVAEYDENAASLAKAITVSRSDISGYADADAEEAPLSRTYTVTIPPYTEECPSLTKIIVFNAAYPDAQTEINVKYAPFFTGDFNSWGATIDPVTRLIDLQKVVNTSPGTVTFFASANAPLEDATIANKGFTDKFYAVTTAEETNITTTNKYGPGKRVTLSYKTLTDSPELAEVSVKETGADASTAKKVYIKCFKAPYFASVAFSPNAANTLVEGKNLYLAVNNGDHGTIDYTVYDDVVKKSFIPRASATYATTSTNPSWVENGIKNATVGDNLEVVSAEFQIVKYVIKVMLPKTIPNPASATKLKVGLSGEPGDIALIPVYPSAYNAADGTSGPIDAKDKAFRPVCVKGYWWAPINVGQTKISALNDPTTAGGYVFQWGRKQAFKWDSPQIPGPVDSAAAAGNNFITNSTSPNDWLKVQNNTLWNSGTLTAPTKTSNDPCPDGWRVPTKDEWAKSMVGTHIWTPGGGSASANGLFTVTGEGSTKLYFPATGIRFYTGVISSQGTSGYNWSSSEFSGIFSSLMTFSTSALTEHYFGRSVGIPVRCVQEFR